MNEVLKNIRQRRSCRQYQPDRQVPEELLQQILEAGTWAPSGMGAQSPVLVGRTGPGDPGSAVANQRGGIGQ